MRITVKFLAQLRLAAGVSTDIMEVAPPCTLGRLLGELAGKHNDQFRRLLVDESGKVNPAILFFVNEDQVKPDLETLLKDNDTVTLLTPMAGG